jgi:hypothetical protein
MKTITSIIGEGAKELRKQRNANKQQVTLFFLTLKLTFWPSFSWSRDTCDRRHAQTLCSSQDVKEHDYILIFTLFSDLPVVALILFYCFWPSTDH